MGNTYTVSAWGDHGLGDGYCYIVTWQGESWFRAVIEVIRAKRKGYGCIKFEWR